MGGGMGIIGKLELWVVGRGTRALGAGYGVLGVLEI